MATQHGRLGVLEILLPAVLAAFFIELLKGDIDEGEVVWRTFLAVPLIVNVALNQLFPLKARLSRQTSGGSNGTSPSGAYSLPSC